MHRTHNLQFILVAQQKLHILIEKQFSKIVLDCMFFCLFVYWGFFVVFFFWGGGVDKLRLSPVIYRTSVVSGEDELSLARTKSTRAFQEPSTHLLFVITHSALAMLLVLICFKINT